MPEFLTEARSKGCLMRVQIHMCKENDCSTMLKDDILEQE